MNLTINSYFKTHYAAVESLANAGIRLNIIPNPSPHVLANTGSPNIVIHPKASLVGNEYPHIKFAGPNCSFPHYPFEMEIGIPDFEVSNSELTDGIIYLNSTNDFSFIKYLESLERPLRIYGKSCHSIYYSGSFSEQTPTYKEYEKYKYIAVDNEQEALIAIKVMRTLKAGQKIYSNFNYIDCINFKDSGLKFKNEDEMFLENKRWVKIFEKLIESMGM